jgi:hypothetical protein
MVDIGRKRGAVRGFHSNPSLDANSKFRGAGAELVGEYRGSKLVSDPNQDT